MDCEEARNLISASIDGRPVDEVALERHLQGCEACRSWRERAHQLSRLGVQPVEEPVSTTDLEAPKGFYLHRWFRFVLAWAGLLLIVWNFGDLFGAGIDPDYVHVARHQAGFSVALGLAFLVVAWRPDRAYGLVPFAVTFSLALGAIALIDLFSGTSTAGREAMHLLELTGLVLVWVLGVSAGPGRRSSRSRGARDSAGSKS